MPTLTAEAFGAIKGTTQGNVLSVVCTAELPTPRNTSNNCDSKSFPLSFPLCFPNDIDVDHVFVFVVLEKEEFVDIARNSEKTVQCMRGLLANCLL